MKQEHRDKPIPSKKTDAVKELVDLSKKKKTVLVVSIKNLPASQFQEISKKLRGNAIVKVPKKNILLRSIDSSDNEKFKTLREMLREDTAILFSDLDSYELASELIQVKTPAKARKGQEAPHDIVVEAGPTDLVPGPAVSELGALGIQIMIDKGKIHIKENKIIVKSGVKISGPACDLMSKLDIKPFLVGFEPLFAFDTVENKIYTEIRIDREGTLNELKIAFGKALPFAVNVGYITEETITLMIMKAGREFNSLEKLMGGNSPKVEKESVVEDNTQSEKSEEENK